ncbi:DUF397 domain-containing protein [Actinomadura sp. WMMB 499]|uniref:DUF397 domain-containing protein n=1 Tax=Actinomadura sp. WMMB 499 TaxID=1219491 RepID=UPI0012479232|nr:DUF397 domain-containing protein [Actinomadura sp. WMMB 499]QFG21726.1 DUF397 domain-containing protein [Actinomadura sp. WMMB 499]
MKQSVVTWRKASRSTDTGGNCVELAGLPQGIGIRDSKDPDGAKLVIRRDSFRALLTHLEDHGPQ